MTYDYSVCGLCGQRFPFGPHRYDGKFLKHYKLMVCQSCYDGSWNGISPANEEGFEAHLKEQGIPLPERNEKGWYPRGF